ncbi:MAG: hypothetical protein V7641_5066 [Blastocatellia bacterium]
MGGRQRLECGDWSPLLAYTRRPSGDQSPHSKLHRLPYIQSQSDLKMRESFATTGSGVARLGAALAFNLFKHGFGRKAIGRKVEPDKDGLGDAHR